MTKFDIANIMSSSNLAKEIAELIPRGALTTIHDKLTKRFSSKEVIAYENTKNLLLGKISTKVEQRKYALQEALKLVESRKKRIDELMIQTSVAA